MSFIKMSLIKINLIKMSLRKTSLINMSLIKIGLIIINLNKMNLIKKSLIKIRDKRTVSKPKLLQCIFGFTDCPFRNNCEKTVKHWVCFSNSIVQSLKHDVW